MDNVQYVCDVKSQWLYVEDSYIYFFQDLSIPIYSFQEIYLKQWIISNVTIMLRSQWLYAEDSKTFVSLSGFINPNIQFQLSVPKNIALIQNVTLVNKDGNKLSQLQYNPGTDLLPAISIPEHKLSTEPFYLQLTASTNDGLYSRIETVSNSGEQPTTWLKYSKVSFSFSFRPSQFSIHNVHDKNKAEPHRNYLMLG
jgi:hypothetical protein